MVHFAWSDVVASLGDDSVSYLMLARYILDPGDATNGAWVGYQSHFPPLFPALLALTGGAWNLAAAHAAVAVFAILSLVLLYRHAAGVLGSDAAGALVAALFVLTPTAWIGISGILSESLYLLVTLWALHYHETRLAGANGRTSRWLAFGLLLGAAILVRSAGVALALAYGVSAGVAAARTRAPGAAKRLLPFAPAALMVGLWLLWRPRPEGFHYGSATAHIVNDLLLADPLRFLASCAQVTFGGWLRSFTADSDVHGLAKAVFAAVGLLGIAGAVLRARANALDGWYVLIALPLVFVLLFSEDNNRRLLYPLVPVLLIHACVCVAFVARRVPSARNRRLLAAAVAALPVALTLPAWLVVQSKSLDRESIHPGLRYRYSDMTDYYTTLDVKAARAIASKHAGFLGGLEGLRAVTPPAAKVMWLRPDYVAVLGRREGVPLYYRWSPEEMLRRIRTTGADYVVVSSLLKTDLEGGESNPAALFDAALRVSTVAHSVRSRVMDGYEIAILKVDHAAID